MEQTPSPPPPLRELLTAYETAIASLNTLPSHPQDARAKVILSVLLARDAIQTRLSQGSLAAEDVLDLASLDAKLQDQQAVIQSFLQLPQWCELYAPDPAAWWWAVSPSDDEVQAREAEIEASQHDWFWNGLAIAFLAISASLILNTASRFWGGSIASAGTLTLAAQSALTLIAGKGALTQSGREGWEKFLQTRGIAEHHWQEWSCAAAGGVLAIVGGLHMSLPAIAILYNNQGENHYLADRLASALGDYQVAINLRPDYPEARYNLGLVYEDLQREEDAIASYRFVVEQDAESVDKLIWLKANNNLARLYILQGNTRDAVPLLIQSLRAVTPEQVATNVDFAKVQYSLLKNRGWARLAQGRYDDAETQLDEAIHLLETTIPSDDELEQQGQAKLQNRGSGYCLMAQVLDAQDRSDEADRVWETCLVEANAGNPDEDTWIGMYEQRSPTTSPTVNEEVPE